MADGVMLHLIKESKFKTVRLMVRFREEMSADTLGKRVLISNMLESTNAVYQTGKDFSRKLSEMYGASFTTGVAKKGKQHLLSLNMSIVNPKLVDFDTLGAAVDFLKIAIFQPDAANGQFNPEIFKREQRNLLHYLASMNDDRSYYASRQLANLFFEDENQALPSVGTSELIAKENPKAVFEYYQKMLTDNAIDIFVLGDVDEKRMIERFSDFNFTDRAVSKEIFYQQSLTESSVVTDEKEVAQSILQFAYQMPIVYGDKNYLALQVMNGLLGGFAHSKLFTNVREKASLAYSISSTFDSFTGFLKIAAGIDVENYEEAKSLIFEQLEAIKSGDFTELEVEQTKTMLRNAYFVGQDSPSNTIELEYVKALIPYKFLPMSEFLKALESVSKADLINVAKSLNLQAEYFMKGFTVNQEKMEVSLEK